jgi:putative transposase
MTEKEKSHGSAFPAGRLSGQNERMKKQFVIDALGMAYRQRKPPKGLLHHSDHGSPYASKDSQNLLDSYGMLAGMSRKGNCWNIETMER